MIPINEIIHHLGATEADDDVLLELERNAVAFVQTQTRRYFGPPELVEELVTGDGSRKLWLTDVPIEAPDDSDYNGSLVAIEGVALPGDDPNATTDFHLRTVGNFAHVHRLAGAVWTRDWEYTAVYWRGYPAGEEPGDIRQLVLDLVAAKWERMGNQGLKSETIGGYEYVRFDGSDLGAVPGANETLNAWRRLVYA